jgi:hypothetical protein
MSSPICSQSSRELQRHWTGPAGKRPCKRLSPARAPSVRNTAGGFRPTAEGRWVRSGKKQPPGSNKGSRRLLNLHPSGVEPETFGSEVMSYAVSCVLFRAKTQRFLFSGVSSSPCFQGWWVHSLGTLAANGYTLHAARHSGEAQPVNARYRHPFREPCRTRRISRWPSLSSCAGATAKVVSTLR